MKPLFHAEISNVKYPMKLAKLRKVSSAKLPLFQKNMIIFVRIRVFFKIENIVNLRKICFVKVDYATNVYYVV